MSLFSSAQGDVFKLLVWFDPMMVYEDGRHDSTPTAKPKNLDSPLVADISAGLKPCPFHIREWDMGQTKKTTKKYMLNKFSQRWFLSFKVFLIMLLYVQVVVSLRFGFN